MPLPCVCLNCHLEMRGGLLAHAYHYTHQLSQVWTLPRRYCSEPPDTCPLRDMHKGPGEREGQDLTQIRALQEPCQRF